MIQQSNLDVQEDKNEEVKVPEWFKHDKVAQKYQDFFEMLDWSVVKERDSSRTWCGRLPHPEKTYIKAHLVMICEGHDYVTDLRRYLVEHPVLVWQLGFRLKADETSPYGFDVEASVPTARHFRRKLQTFDEALLTALLINTVELLSEGIPNLGKTVSLDTKHIYAYVKENNPRAYVKDRYDPQKQPKADHDCRLGVKRKQNQTDKNGNLQTETEYLWGYGTGIAVTKTDEKDEIILAELTQPFNAADVTYGLPLLEQVYTHLGYHPTNITADAGFDVWYMYQGCAERGGLAAIALNLRGHSPTEFGENGYPICPECGQERTPCSIWKQKAVRKQSFTCFGCRTHRILIIELGGWMRLQLDRQSDEYKSIYKQRTATERINSQAKELGIERPRVQNGRSIAHRNTLIYIVINLKALQRIRERKRDLELTQRVA